MWYLVNVFHRSDHIPALPAEKTVWEETFVLVDAENEEHAREKVSRKASTDQTAYTSTTEDSVVWNFVGSPRVQYCEELTDGAELFSRFLRNSEAISLLRPFEDE